MGVGNEGNGGGKKHQGRVPDGSILTARSWETTGTALIKQKHDTKLKEAVDHCPAERQVRLEWTEDILWVGWRHQYAFFVSFLVSRILYIDGGCPQRKSRSMRFACECPGMRILGRLWRILSTASTLGRGSD